MQIDQLVIDEGEAAIEAEAPHPRAPLPDLPPVPGTTFYCNVSEVLALHTPVLASALRTSVLCTHPCPIKQSVALARAGGQVLV